MKTGLTKGDSYRFSYRIPDNKTVPHIYPEAEEFSDFPEIFATGFLVALMEWTCVQALEPYLEDHEGSLGIHIDMSHEAATPPGFDVEVNVTLLELAGRILRWQVTAHDGVDIIGKGTHKRAIIDRRRFNERTAAKADAALQAP